MEINPLSAYNYLGEAIVGRRDTGDLGGATFLTDPYHFTTGYNIKFGNTSGLAALDVNQIIVSTLPGKYASCLVATTENITLSGLQTVDGVVLVAGNRVVVKDQTTASQNGIYDAAIGAWNRSADAGTGYFLTTGKYARITGGATNANTWAVISVPTFYTLNTSPVTFVLISGDCVELEERTNYFLRFKNIGTLTRTYFFGILAATTANITLSGLQTIDGVALVAGNKVLVKNQSTGVSGVYTVASSSWTLYAVTVYNKFYFVSEGTTNGGKTFVSTIAAPATMLHLSMILYPTLEDATSETNPIIPLYTTNFKVHWIFKTYSIFECIELGAAEVEDIICCPAPVAMHDFLPSTATITKADSSTVTATIYDDPYNQEFMFLYNFFYSYTSDLPMAWGGYYYQPQGTFEVVRIYLIRGSDSFTVYVLVETPPVYGDGSYPNNKIRWFTSSGGLVFGAGALSGGIPEANINSSITVTEYFASSPPPTPEQWTVNFSVPFELPPTIALSMTDAKFKNVTQTVVGGVVTATDTNDIALGNISVTLTYDAETGYYFGPLENYYNIPGRLHMQSHFFDAAPKFNDANGNYNNKLECDHAIFIGAQESKPTIKVNNSGILYFDNNAADSRFYIRYSTYKRARKGLNFEYDSTTNYFGGTIGSTNSQVYHFFNSNAYWVESSDVTLTG